MFVGISSLVRSHGDEAGCCFWEMFFLFWRDFVILMFHATLSCCFQRFVSLCCVGHGSGAAWL